MLYFPMIISVGEGKSKYNEKGHDSWYLPCITRKMAKRARRKVWSLIVVELGPEALMVTIKKSIRMLFLY